jgi:hypothetical protein
MACVGINGTKMRAELRRGRRNDGANVVGESIGRGERSLFGRRDAEHALDQSTMCRKTDTARKPLRGKSAHKGFGEGMDTYHVSFANTTYTAGFVGDGDPNGLRF